MSGMLVPTRPVRESCSRLVRLAIPMTEGTLMGVLYESWYKSRYFKCVSVEIG